MKKAKIAAISALSGQIAAILFILLTGYFATKAEDPERWTSACSYIALSVAALVCGGVSVKMSEENSLLQPLFGGGLLLIFTALFSFLPKLDGTTGKNGWEILLSVLIIVVLSMTPALICGISKSSNRNSRKKARKKAGKMYRRRG